MQKITIAIDGHSSTGKSTIARQLAKALDYIYVDSGAMYRAVTLYALRNGMFENDTLQGEKLIAALPEITLRFGKNDSQGKADMYLNGENVEKSIRTLEVSGKVSIVAAIAEVRKKLVEQQREMGRDKGVVMDGRDIGTVVFPDADLKLFITASAETRAQRRYKELIDRGDQVSFDEVLENVRKRDHLDSTRKESPLIRAEDAIAIDNSHMTIEEQFAAIMDRARACISEKQESGS
ncbi:(d)CMP kinase [Robertkochia aurantiaca]|uniref:(d)CMP kinase n=1 Tax=Robertkochia aurantiaca TaxID=2873700 RepID=UPI001CD02FA0|nr:(d)CMP kinase [Robertkochia sp. 3YJGBD-33]